MKPRLLILAVLLGTATWLTLTWSGRADSAVAHRTASLPIDHNTQVTTGQKSAPNAWTENDGSQNDDVDQHALYLPINPKQDNGADEGVTTIASSPNAITLPDGMRTFHGDLHSHTSYSDGKGTPQEAFQMARDNGLDFFTVTDHAYMLNDTEWTDVRAQAKAATTDGEFIGLYGYEWTSNNGHINFYNTSKLVKANDRDYDTVEELYAWLSKPAQVNTLAQFNHPFYPPDSFNNLEYNRLADRHIFLMEIHDGNAVRTDKFNEGLDAGWRFAPTDNSDAHTKTWGMKRGRNGIIAPALTYQNIINALRARRIFATQDENLLLALRADDYWMGSVIRNGPVHFDIYAFDPDPGDAIATLELFENGAAVKRIDPYTNDFTWTFTLPELRPPGTRWYVKATQADGDIAYTSPVWRQQPEPHDVMIRDNMWDVGDVPTTDPDWQSPDIWVRRQEDGQIWHENPVPGQTNYVHTRVHNIGLNSIADADVYVYWALPTVGFTWPGNWHLINPAPVRVPELAPGETTIVSIPWNVPTTNPDYVSLLVRLVSGKDSIYYKGNAKWDNNIAWKNVNIVKIPSAASIGSALASDDLTFYLANPFANNKAANILFASSEFPAGGSLTLHLTTDLFDRWMASVMGGEVKGATVDPGQKAIHVTSPADAAIYGLPLQADESSAATLTLAVPGGSSVSVHMSEHIDNEQVGGVTYTTAPSHTPSKIYIVSSANQILVDRSTELTALVVGDGFIPVPDDTTVQFSTNMGELSATQVKVKNGVATVTFKAGFATGTAVVEASVGGKVLGRVPINVYRTCWVRLNDDPTDFFTVQAAIDGSSNPTDVVKVAGRCALTNNRNNLAQVAYINKTLTLRGGYTTTNWTESDPLAHPTTLDPEGHGRVLVISGDISPKIENFHISGGDASGLGGGPSDADVGGGLYIAGAAAVIKGNRITNNNADDGSGIHLSSSDARLVNNIVTDNQASGGGSGIFIEGSSPQLLHNTIARNGTGIHITNNGANNSAVALVNTIIVGHDVGLSVSAGNAATLQGTLWGTGVWANGTDWTGAGTVSTGGQNLHGNPDFTCLGRTPECIAGTATMDYHIGANSAAQDTGVDGQVLNDIDGDARSDDHPDLGADELFFDLEVTKSAYPVRVKTGGQLSYTIHLTNTGDADLHATIIDTLPAFILPGVTPDGQPIQPGGTLSWTPAATAPGGAWKQTFAVSAQPAYVGPLTNTVEVNTQEGATGSYVATPRTYIERLDFLPLSTLRADMTLCAPRFITERDTGSGPRQVALDIAGRRVFVAHADGITVIDLDSFAAITTISSPTMAHGIAYDPDHDRIWVTRNKADRVVVLDGATYAPLADLPTGDEPHSVAYNSANGRVYVTNYLGWTVSVYNADTLTFVTELTDFAEPAHLVVNSDTNKIYVANHRPGTHVTVIDGVTHSTQRIPTNLIDAYGITLDADRNLVYVTAIAHGRISIIDGSTDVELGFLNIQRDNGKRVPLRVIAVNPDMGPQGHLLVVTSSEDGGKDQLLLIPNGWPSLGRPVPLDLAPYPLEGIAVDPNTDRVWVTNVGSGVVSVVQDGEAVCPFQLTTSEAELDFQGEYEIRVEVNP